jgi:hypothetical protein
MFGNTPSARLSLSSRKNSGYGTDGFADTVETKAVLVELRCGMVLL